jgi:hypothetical protein
MMQKRLIAGLRRRDWGLKIPPSDGWASRGSPKNRGPFPKRAKPAATRLMMIIAVERRLGFSFKRDNTNQVQLAGSKAKPA